MWKYHLEIGRSNIENVGTFELIEETQRRQLRRVVSDVIRNGLTVWIGTECWKEIERKDRKHFNTIIGRHL